MAAVSHSGQSKGLERTYVETSESGSTNEEAALLQALGASQPTLPHLALLSDSSVELNRKWLNALNKYTQNYEKLPPGDTATITDSLLALHCLTFSRHEETRQAALQPYKKWFTTLSHGKSYDVSMTSFYTNPQQEHVGTVMAAMKRQKIPHIHKKHTNWADEEFHVDLTTRIAECHFELYSTQLWDSKTMINFWLKICERASKHPRDHRLLGATAKLYSNVFCQYWGEVATMKPLVGIMEVPFKTYRKNYCGDRQPKENVLDARGYTLSFFKAALQFYEKSNNAAGFTEFWNDAILTIQASSASSSFINFLAESIKLYSAYIDKLAFTKTDHFKTVYENLPIEALELFHHIPGELLTLQANFLEKIDSFPKLESFCEELNVAGDGAAKSSLYAVIEAAFLKGSSHLEAMARYLTTSVITDSTVAQQVFNDFVSKLSVDETMEGQRAEFMSILVENSVHKNFMLQSIMDFEDLMCRVATNSPGFVDSMYSIFAKMSGNEQQPRFCTILGEKLDCLIIDEFTMDHIKVYVRYMLDATIDGEEEIAKFKLFWEDNVQNGPEDRHGELNLWFGTSKVQQLIKTLGVADPDRSTGQEIMATPESDENMLPTSQRSGVSMLSNDSDGMILASQDIIPRKNVPRSPSLEAIAGDTVSSSGSKTATNSQSTTEQSQSTSDEATTSNASLDHSDLGVEACEMSVQTSFKSLPGDKDYGELNASDFSRVDSDHETADLLSEASQEEEVAEQTSSLPTTASSHCVIPAKAFSPVVFKSRTRSGSSPKASPQAGSRKPTRASKRTRMLTRRNSNTMNTSSSDDDLVNDENSDPSNPLPEIFVNVRNSQETGGKPKVAQTAQPVTAMDGRITPTDSELSGELSKDTSPNGKAYDQHTPTRRGSILKPINAPMTPNTRRVMFEQSRNVSISQNGTKNHERLVPEDKDTRGSKKRKQIAASRLQAAQAAAGSPRPMRPHTGTPIPTKVQPQGLLSRGFAMFQAAARLSPKPPTQPHRASLHSLQKPVSSTPAPETSTQNSKVAQEPLPVLSESMIPERPTLSPAPPAKTRRVEFELKSIETQTPEQDCQKCLVRAAADKKAAESVSNAAVVVEEKTDNSSEPVEIRSAALFWMARYLIRGEEPNDIRKEAMEMFSKAELYDAYTAMCTQCKMVVHKDDLQKNANQLCKEILEIICVPGFKLDTWKFCIPLELDDRLPFFFYPFHKK